MYGQTAGKRFVVLLSRVVRETDMLLYWVFTQFIFFWNTQLFSKQGLIKSKRINEYPVKIVDDV